MDDFELPEELEYVRSAIGLLGAMLVGEHFGGTMFFIPTPRTLTDDHKLVAVLGRARAVQLCQHYELHSSRTTSDKFTNRGQMVEMPQGRTAFARLRTRAMLQAGYSANDVARAVGVSRRSVFRWIVTFLKNGDVLDEAIAADSEFEAYLKRLGRERAPSPDQPAPEAGQ